MCEAWDGGKTMNMRLANLFRPAPRLVVTIGQETYSAELHPKQLLTLAASMGENVTSEVEDEVKTSRINPYDTYMVCFSDRETPALEAFTEQVKPLLSTYADAPAIRSLRDFLSPQTVPAFA